MEATGGNVEDLSRLLERPFSWPPAPAERAEKILASRPDFGITRLGSVTGLDRIGIPVVQAVRPSSRSVTVNQGKGLTYAQAAMSALMESLEGWASERIPARRVREAHFDAMNADGIWSYLLPDDGREQRREALHWINGWDFLSKRSRPVPLALVDTNYVIPSPHPQWLARNTTGLAAGTSLQQAMTHACLEILERHACCRAMRTPHFLDRFQVGVDTIRRGEAGGIVTRLRDAGFATGIWTIPSGHGLPVYWSQIMESVEHVPLAPLPAAGFACDISHDRALSKALLEACQSRLGVISGAREDVTGHFYAQSDAAELSGWRKFLSRAELSYPEAEPEPPRDNVLTTLLNALEHAGATAVIAVVVFSDDSVPLHVVRVVASPLETNPDG